jgi:hypothetical protein
MYKVTLLIVGDRRAKGEWRTCRIENELDEERAAGFEMFAGNGEITVAQVMQGLRLFRNPSTV